MVDGWGGSGGVLSQTYCVKGQPAQSRGVGRTLSACPRVDGQMAQKRKTKNCEHGTVRPTVGCVSRPLVPSSHAMPGGPMAPWPRRDGGGMTRLALGFLDPIFVPHPHPHPHPRFHASAIQRHQSVPSFARPSRHAHADNAVPGSQAPRHTSLPTAPVRPLPLPLRPRACRVILGTATAASPSRISSVSCLLRTHPPPPTGPVPTRPKACKAKLQTPSFRLVLPPKRRHHRLAG